MFRKVLFVTSIITILLSGAVATAGDMHFKRSFIKWIPRGFTSIADCRRYRGTERRAALGYDSDHDGIMDDNEDLNQNCACDAGETCWYEADTDRDDINDGNELPGCALNSDPTCGGLLDTDGDDLTDDCEARLGTDPRNSDTDGDGISDGIEDRDHDCIYEPADGETNPLGFDAFDTDRDGLINACEARLGTDPHNPDTDGDGIGDGEEDSNHNCIYEPEAGETNPLQFDTDNDGLPDSMELRYGTDPANPDTDDDCILDGMEDANHNGVYDTGETNALNADTDGDGLSDGNIADVGEDLNCNRIVDVSADGNKLETDPQLADTDGDGQNDFVEMTCGDAFNLANIEKATDPEIACGM